MNSEVSVFKIKETEDGQKCKNVIFLKQLIHGTVVLINSGANYSFEPMVFLYRNTVQGKHFFKE